MSTTRITRETCVQISVRDFIVSKLASLGYTIGTGEGNVEVLDGYPDDNYDLDVDHTAVAIYFDDDGGRRIELGSTLTERVYIFTFDVVSDNARSAKSVAHNIRRSLDEEGRIPFIDYRLPGAVQVGVLSLGDIAVDQEVVDEPKPWQRNRWLVTTPVIDTFYV